MLIIKNKHIRAIVKWAVPLVLCPAAVLLSDKSYQAAALLAAVLTICVLYASFEKRMSGSRRIVITAVMTALSVVGRLAFSAVPAFKPINAVVIISGVWLGAETGFTVGSLSALISNFYFGQGPWTVFQMCAWGLTGFCAGLIEKPLKNGRVWLSIYGVIAGIGYSLVMDVWTVLWMSDGFSTGMYLTAIATALPHTISYAVSNVIFLNILGKPFGEKLERVKIKYRI